MNYFIARHIELDPSNKIFTFGYSLKLNTYATTCWLQQWWDICGNCWNIFFNYSCGKIGRFQNCHLQYLCQSCCWSVFVETASVTYRITNLFIDSSTGLTSRNLVLWLHWFICFVFKALLILTPLDIVLLISGSCCEEIFGPGFLWRCIGSVQMWSKYY